MRSRHHVQHEAIGRDAGIAGEALDLVGRVAESEADDGAGRGERADLLGRGAGVAVGIAHKEAADAVLAGFLDEHPDLAEVDVAGIEHRVAGGDEVQDLVNLRLRKRSSTIDSKAASGASGALCPRARARLNLRR